MRCCAGETNLARRDFLRLTAGGALGGLAAAAVPRWARGEAAAAPGSAAAPSRAAAPSPAVAPCRAALTAGESRADNIFQALKLIEPDIKKSLAGKKRVVIKPNMVGVTRQLCATHVDCVEGILEFLKPLVKEEILIAESPGPAPAAEGFSNYGYYALQKKYNVKFVDLDQEPTEILYAVNEHFRPTPIRMAKLVTDPGTYVISAAVMKTHDRVVATLSLKNVVVGAAIKDPGFVWGHPTIKSDKVAIHGGNANNEGIHFNIFTLGRQLHPHLAINDGFQGMQGNGPMGGTAVDQKVAVASTDWLAADRLAVELMGIDLAKIGYLSFAAQEGLGQADLAKIEVLGQRVKDHVRPYRLHDKIAAQLRWMER